MSSNPRSARDSRRASTRLVAFVLLLYAGLAVASTWPLARDPGGLVPRGTLESTTIPLVSAWALWWTADRLPAGFASYWDAPIFHPAARRAHRVCRGRRLGARAPRWRLAYQLPAHDLAVYEGLGPPRC